MFTKGLVLLGSAVPALASSLEPRQSDPLDACPGYTASNVQTAGSTVTADLTLAGDACNAYGNDLTNLRLLVEYQTGMSSSLQRALNVYRQLMIGQRNDST
jgi:alpha-glucosidase